MDAAPFLDFRTMAAPFGVRVIRDLAELADDGPVRCLVSPDPVNGIVLVRATRTADGFEVTADREGYEPVTEGGMLVGLRFPGCDRFPWQPYDPERDGDD